MTDTLTQRVAEALHHCDQQEGALPCAYKDLSKHQKRWFEEQAQAAIEASGAQHLQEKIKQYEAMFHLVAHEVVFVSEDDSSCFVRPETWIIAEGKILNFFGNVNDTFGYACADCEEMSLEECVEVFEDACKRFPEKPWIAVALWAQKKRGGMKFIEPVQKMVDEALAALPEELRGER